MDTYSHTTVAQSLKAAEKARENQPKHVRLYQDWSSDHMGSCPNAPEILKMILIIWTDSVTHFWRIRMVVGKVTHRFHLKTC